MKKSLLAVSLIWGCIISAQGALVTFDLLGNDAFATLDGKASGSITNAGLVATLSASEGVLNKTTIGFGINGPGDDDTDALNLDQYIDLIFDQEITFRNVNVSSWGNGSSGEVRLGSDFILASALSGSGDTAVNFTVTTGQTVRIIATGETSSTNGFSFDSFTVETIPEPAVISFIMLAGLGALVIKRFKT